MEFIAIDIGTSFIKGAVVDVQTLNIRNVHRRAAPGRLENRHPFLHEQSADLITRTVAAVIGDLLPASPHCSGILMCGQMGGLVLCSDIGEALSPYISWLDRRATMPHPQREQSYFDCLAAEVGQRSQFVLGNEFRPGLPLSFLYCLRETGDLNNFPGAIPVTLPDYVAAALCHCRPMLEFTSATGVLDVRSQTLPGELFADLKMNDLNWPEIVDFRHRVGEFVTDGRSLPVYAPTGDHQCSLAGTLIQPGELSINVSTGSQVSMLTDDVAVGNFQLRPYFDGQFLKTVTNIPAGRALSAIMKLLTEISGAESANMQQAWDYFFEQAEKTHQTDINVSLALFPGAIEGAGCFGNLREDNLTVGHLARGCLEQMADHYNQFAERLAPGRDWKNLVFSGGVAQRSALLRTLVSARLNSDCRTTTSTEDALFGMLVLGRVIAGLNESVAAATEFVAAAGADEMNL